MPNIKLKTISPGQLSSSAGDGLFDVSGYDRKYLAQGDSWFSIGHVPFWSTANLLEKMVLSRSALAVSCARPGKELQHTTDTSTDQVFLNLLNGNAAWKWDALLVSGGGNDLIAAANAKRSAALADRLLRTSDEWLAGPGADRYLSEAGWSTFTAHMEEVLVLLLAQRDQEALNRDIPLLVHTYDYATARDAPAGPGMGPWLYRAFHDTYKIPPQDWAALADLLIDRVADMWSAIATAHADRGIHVVDTRGTLERAKEGSTGVSGGWENEIHPTSKGYGQLGKKWRLVLDALP